MDELEEMKAKMEKARSVAVAEQVTGAVEGIAPGMKVDAIAEAEAEAETDEQAGAELFPPKKMPGRKTKQQRKKAERLREEVWPHVFL